MLLYFGGKIVICVISKTKLCDKRHSVVKILTEATATATKVQTNQTRKNVLWIWFWITKKQATHYTEVNLLTHDFHSFNDTESHEQTYKPNQFFFIDLWPLIHLLLDYEWQWPLPNLKQTLWCKIMQTTHVNSESK